MLIVGRFINGFCVGICSAQVPVYISELAPPSKRGRLVGAQQWAITWGILIMSVAATPPTVPAPAQLTMQVLHFLWLLLHQRHSRIPCPMGPPNDSRNPPFHWNVFLARITPLASSQRPLGRLPCCSNISPRQRRPQQPLCNT